MKAKHWAGYGSVTVTKLEKKEHLLTVRVIGNHERGLRPLWNDTAYDWLVHRFDRNAPERYDTKTMAVLYEEGFTDTPNKYGNYTEQCDITFIY